MTDTIDGEQQVAAIEQMRAKEGVTPTKQGRGVIRQHLDSWGSPLRVRHGAVPRPELNGDDGDHWRNACCAQVAVTEFSALRGDNQVPLASDVLGLPGMVSELPLIHHAEAMWATLAVRLRTAGCDLTETEDAMLTQLGPEGIAAVADTSMEGVALWNAHIQAIILDRLGTREGMSLETVIRAWERDGAAEGYLQLAMLTASARGGLSYTGQVVTSFTHLATVAAGEAMAAAV